MQGKGGSLFTTLRWVLYWYGRATVNRFDAGSIPASAAFQRETEGQAGPIRAFMPDRCPRRQPPRDQLASLPVGAWVERDERLDGFDSLTFRFAER